MAHRFADEAANRRRLFQCQSYLLDSPCSSRELEFPAVCWRKLNLWLRKTWRDDSFLTSSFWKAYSGKWVLRFQFVISPRQKSELLMWIPADSRNKTFSSVDLRQKEMRRVRWLSVADGNERITFPPARSSDLTSYGRSEWLIDSGLSSRECAEKWSDSSVLRRYSKIECAVKM